MNAKVFIARDQFDAMVTAALNDKLLRENHQGVRRMVSPTQRPANGAASSSVLDARRSSIYSSPT